MNIDQYLGVFIDETRENLQNLNSHLLALENNLNDKDLLNEIFRISHTLKGMAGTMGFEKCAKLTHSMESVLDPMRNGTMVADSSTIDVLFECLDSLESILNSIINTGSDNVNTEELVKKLEVILSNPLHDNDSVGVDHVHEEFKFNEYDINILQHAKSKGFSQFHITVFLDSDCLLPAARAFIVERTLEPYGEIIKTLPDTEKLENGEFNGSFKLCYLSESDIAYIQSIVKEVPEVSDVKITLIQDLESIVNNDESVVENTTTDNQDSKVEKNNSSKAKVPQTIRVNAERLDKLMNLVGELVINRTRVQQIASDNNYFELNNSFTVMESVTSDIQEIVMSLRMVPIENVFNRFPRLVRDISKELGKEIDLKISGQDTEMDRLVIEEIGDPLVHLIRNSMDHGLETTEERVNSGKPSKGVLELTAFNEGDNIIIQVKDDGKGLDVERIKNKAISKGIVSHDMISKMTDKEIKELIFLPGFSTNDVANDLSGRGVGMDVVKTRISNLGGTVYLESEKNVGTKITICLPSTMAIVKALLMKVSEEVYAVPLSHISEIVNIKSSEIHTIQKKEVIFLRDKTLPILRLHQMLDIRDNRTEQDAELTVVVMSIAEKMIGFVVSSLVGQQEVVIKPINKKLCKADYFSGATTLGNGEVALIVNATNLIK